MQQHEAPTKGLRHVRPLVFQLTDRLEQDPVRHLFLSVTGVTYEREPLPTGERLVACGAVLTASPLVMMPLGKTPFVPLKNYFAVIGCSFFVL